MLRAFRRNGIYRHTYLILHFICNRQVFLQPFSAIDLVIGCVSELKHRKLTVVYILCTIWPTFKPAFSLKFDSLGLVCFVQLKFRFVLGIASLYLRSIRVLFRKFNFLSEYRSTDTFYHLVHFFIIPFLRRLNEHLAIVLCFRNGSVTLRSTLSSRMKRSRLSTM